MGKVKIEWSRLALLDVQMTLDYIRKDSLTYANRFRIKLNDLVKSIAFFPEKGRIVPELDRPDVREIIWGNYRLIYQYKAGVVFVVTFIHSARDLGEDTLDNRFR